MNDVNRHTKLQIVIGAAWGSEGKGRVLEHLAIEADKEGKTMIAVRVGAPNAGHTVTCADGKDRAMQSIPVATFVRRNVIPVLGPAALIDPEVLMREIDWLKEVWVNAPKILVSTNATIVTEEHRQLETELVGRIGSTGKGCGEAMVQKIRRNAVTFEKWVTHGLGGERFARYVEFIDNVADYLIDSPPGVNLIQVEGTQGVLLNLHDSSYPYCTSRQVNFEGILGEIGITERSFQTVERWAVMRTYPIRVSGNSGPMWDEITWDELSAEVGKPVTPEQTTVTKKIRRISRMDFTEQAAVMNRIQPTHVALTFLDYLDPTSEGQLLNWEDLTKYPKIMDFMENLWIEGISVNLASSGAGKFVSVKEMIPTPQEFQNWLLRSANRTTDNIRKLPNIPPGVVKQAEAVMGNILSRLKKGGEDYGEETIYTTGENGLINIVVWKALRLLFSASQEQNYESRKDSWLDLAGYSVIAQAMEDIRNGG